MKASTAMKSTHMSVANPASTRSFGLQAARSAASVNTHINQCKTGRHLQAGGCAAIYRTFRPSNPQALTAFSTVILVALAPCFGMLFAGASLRARARARATPGRLA